MMGKEVARNMYSFMTEQIWIISVSGWLLKRKGSVASVTYSLSIG